MTQNAQHITQNKNKQYHNNTNTGLILIFAISNQSIK